MANDFFGLEVDLQQNAVFLQPKASKNEVVGLYDRRLKIKAKAPPVDGAVNKELIQFLPKLSKLSKFEVQLVEGTSSRKKTVKIPYSKEYLISGAWTLLNLLFLPPLLFVEVLLS